MKLNKILSPFTFCLLALISYTIGSLWLYKHVQTPAGNSQFFLILPLMIGLYLIGYLSLKSFFEKIQHTPTSSTLPIFALSIYKLCETCLLFSISAFTLVSHFLLNLLIFMKFILIGKMLYQFFSKKNHTIISLKPDYDLVILAGLASIIAYIPEIYTAYPLIKIQFIKFILDGALSCMLIILLINFFKSQ